jgi:hypothetical protein
MPALLTRMSSRPCDSAMPPMAAAKAAASEMSTAITLA